jgi:hypothetical protein
MDRFPLSRIAIDKFGNQGTEHEGHERMKGVIEPSKVASHDITIPGHEKTLHGESREGVSMEGGVGGASLAS